MPQSLAVAMEIIQMFKQGPTVQEQLRPDLPNGWRNWSRFLRMSRNSSRKRIRTVSFPIPITMKQALPKLYKPNCLPWSGMLGMFPPTSRTKSTAPSMRLWTRWEPSSKPLTFKSIKRLTRLAISELSL